MDQIIGQAMQAESPGVSTEKPKRSWRRPEIVSVGGVLDLTEAVGDNLNDSPSGSFMVSYKP